MAGGRDRDTRTVREARGPPPIQFGHAVQPDLGEVAGIAQRRDDSWVIPPPDRPQAGEIHMIVMVVRQEQQIDFGQIVQHPAGGTGALRPRPGDGRAALAEDRIGEDGQVRQADQEAAMADEGDRGGPRRRQAVRIATGWRVRRQFGPRLTILAEAPLQNADQSAALARPAARMCLGRHLDRRNMPLRRHGRRVEEDGTIKMV